MYIIINYNNDSEWNGELNGNIERWLLPRGLKVPSRTINVHLFVVYMTSVNTVCQCDNNLIMRMVGVQKWMMEKDPSWITGCQRMGRHWHTLCCLKTSDPLVTLVWRDQVMKQTGSLHLTDAGYFSIKDILFQ